MNSTAHNPYAAPLSSLLVESPIDCYRDRNLLVIPQLAKLPHRCVKCNAPVERMDQPRRYTWHHAGWYALMLATPVVYAVVASLVQDKSKVAIGLCPWHRARRRNLTAVSLMLFLTGMLLLVFGAGSNRSLAQLIGLGAVLTGMMVASVSRRILSAAQINKVETRLKGCGAAFLDSLPLR